MNMSEHRGQHSFDDFIAAANQCARCLVHRVAALHPCAGEKDEIGQTCCMSCYIIGIIRLPEIPAGKSSLLPVGMT